MSAVASGTTRPLRIGDAERDRAVSVLADHFAAGRLEKAEYEERVAVALGATHQHDLAPLFDDLPGPDFGNRGVGESSQREFRSPAAWPAVPAPGWGARPAMLVVPRSDHRLPHHRHPAGPPWPFLVIPFLAILLVAVVASSPWVLFLGIWVACIAGRRFSGSRSGRPGPPHSARGVHRQR